MYSMRGILRRHWRLLSFVLGIIITFWLLYALRGVILPFIIGLTFAYLLQPLISWMEKKLPGQGKWRQTKRVSLIITVFILLLALIAVLSYYVVTALVDAFAILINNIPQYITRGLFQLREWTEFIRQQVPADVQYELDKILLDAGAAVGEAIRSALLGGVTFVPSNLGLVAGFAALPVFLFYILKDSEKLTRSFYS